MCIEYFLGVKYSVRNGESVKNELRFFFLMNLEIESILIEFVKG